MIDFGLSHTVCLFKKIFFYRVFEKVFLLICILFIYLNLLATLCGMWDLSALTRDRIHTPGLEAESLIYWTTRVLSRTQLFLNWELDAGSQWVHGPLDDTHSLVTTSFLSNHNLPRWKSHTRKWMQMRKWSMVFRQRQDNKKCTIKESSGSCYPSKY